MSINLWPACNCEADAYDEYRRKVRVEKLLSASGIDPVRWDEDLSGFRWDDGYEQARKIFTEYQDEMFDRLEKGRALIITGAKGTGKTRLTTYLLLRCIKEREMDVVYVPVANLYSYFRDDHERHKWVDRCKATEVLLLDDLGESQIEYWNRLYLTIIINTRYERKRPIFVNSMRSLTELKRDEICGDHLLSRLLEMNRGGLIRIKSTTDYRVMA